MKKGSILFVYVDLSVRESLRLTVEPIYEAHTAANGPEALQYIFKGSQDLLSWALFIQAV